MKRVAVILTLLLCVSCQKDFSRQMYRGLAVSGVSWQSLMNAVDLAELRDDISPGAARLILDYEERHRTTHNQIAALTTR